MHSDKAVLVGYDGSSQSRLALRWALDEARRRRLPVTILHADIPDVLLNGLSMGYYEPTGDARQAEGQALLTDAAALAAEWAPGVSVSPMLVAASPANAVLGALGDASVVVLGSRGLDGFRELLIGSTSLQVATHATVPVVVTRTNEDVPAGPEAGRVVVGVDGSEAAQDALRFGFDEASLRGVGITAIRAWHSAYFESRGAKGGSIPSTSRTRCSCRERRRHFTMPWLAGRPSTPTWTCGSGSFTRRRLRPWWMRDEDLSSSSSGREGVAGFARCCSAR